jgi:hypothetical protein
MLTADLLKPIIDELHANPLPVSNYRQKTSPTKQSVFGVASRRGQPADYSKLCASHPATYKLLLELAEHLSLPPFSSILVSQGAPHTIKIKNASNMAYIVSCDAEGAEGTLAHSELPSIKLSEPTAHTLLVFYTAPNSSWLPAPSVVLHDGRLVFKRGDDMITPSSKRSKKCTTGLRIEHRDVQIYFP